MNADINTLRDRINNYLNIVPRWRCDVVDVGPFDAFLNRGGGHPWLSYARPARPLEADLQGQIQAVRRTFKDRGYVPRWEYIQELTPQLTDALFKAGFPAPEMRPLMYLASHQQTKSPAGVRIRRVTRDTDLLEASRVQGRGFGMPEDETFDLRDLVDGGIRAMAAYADGIAVAAGVHTPVAGVTELAGIATLEGYRRRGIGAALTAALAKDAREQGCDLIFLSAGDENIARIYARAGFEPIGFAADTMDAES